MKNIIIGLVLLSSVSSYATSTVSGDYNSTIVNDECRDKISVESIQDSQDIKVKIESTRNCYLKSNHLSIPRNAEIIFTPVSSEKEGIVNYEFKSSPSEKNNRGANEDFDSYGCKGTSLIFMEKSESIHINYCTRKVGLGVQGRARLESMAKLYLKQ